MSEIKVNSIKGVSANLPANTSDPANPTYLTKPS